MILTTGRATPFVNISLSGLLWGYNDELPCYSLNRPENCPDKSQVDLFDEDEDEDDGWGSDSWRRKREAAWEEGGAGEPGPPKAGVADLRDLNFTALTKPKAELVGTGEDCKCEWGLFRDRNVTLRKAVRLYTGQGELSSKGRMVEYGHTLQPTLGWWQPGSKCDAVGGQGTNHQ